jgi:hypothetical protein
MDRITRQSPRQQGHGTTSSLRNDSLKHTRKQEKGREESNQEAKHTCSGGPSDQEGRTVRTGHADRPACYRGLSARTPRTFRPCAADRPKNQTEPPETTSNNGPRNQNGSKAKPSKNTKNTRRTRTSRTVCHLLADCPRLADRAETSSTSKVNLSNPSPDLPNGRSC